MWNVILLIVGFFLTKKSDGGGGGSRDSDSGGGGASGISSATWDKIILGGFFALLYVMFKKASDANKREEAYNEAPSNPAVQQAIAIRQAVNPSGLSWLIDYDTTDEAAIMALAPQIGKAWANVQTAYQSLYTESLVERLTKELGQEDFAKFLMLLNGGTGTPSAGTPSTGTTTPGKTPTGNPDAYQVAGYASVTGKIVKVLRGKTVYHTNVNPRRVFAAGTTLGAAKGWKKNSAGKVELVYEYNPGLFSKNELHTVDPYTVYLQ